MLMLVEACILSNDEQPACHEVTYLAIRKYIRMRLHAHAAALCSNRCLILLPAKVLQQERYSKNDF
jgi:hypothetical protein